MNKEEIITENWNGIAVFIEQDNGRIEDISLELLGKARELADEHNEIVYAYLFGENLQEMGKELIAYGADRVILAEDSRLDHYKWETYSKIGEQLINTYKPSMLIMGATPNGRDLAGRLAVRLHTGLTADVIDLEIQKDLLLGSVPGFGGSVVAVIKCETARPQMATVRPGIFSVMNKDNARSGAITNFPVKLSDDEITTKLIRKITVDKEDISKTKRLIAAGRGVGSNLSLAQEMAELLDGKIGVTRPLCDMGLLPRNYQIGSTGVTTKPEFTIVWGASGAMHFTSGINKSDLIISVNIDEEAPIFQQSDYYAVEDINKLLPLVLSKLKQKLSQEVQEAERI